jgi:hypothetical protein
MKAIASKPNFSQKLTEAAPGSQKSKVKSQKK